MAKQRLAMVKAPSSSSSPTIQPGAADGRSTLIGEVAKRHNALLGPNDPILVTLTLNELILEDY
jgi:hypothetical protein